MKRTIVTITALAAAAVPVATTPAPAQADGVNCVSYNEFITGPYTHRTALQNYWGVGNGREPGNTVWGNPKLYNVTYPACAGDGYFVSVGYRITTNQAINMIGFFPKKAR